MNVFSRAIIAVLRKPSRSLILLVLMVLIFTALISGAVVRNSIGDLKGRLDRNFKAGFVISAKGMSAGGAAISGVAAGGVETDGGTGVEKTQSGINLGGLTLRQAELVKEVKGIESVNFIQNEVVVSDKYQPVEDARGGVKLDGVRSNFTATFLDDSQLFSEFLNGRYEIKQGRGVLRGGKDEVLIHEEFAEKNHLKLGDELSFKMHGRKIKLVVVGIFTGKDAQMNGFASEAQNRLFISFKTLENVSRDLRLQQVSYFVSDPKTIEEVIVEVKTMNLPWENLVIENNFEKNKDLYQTVEGVEKMLNMMLAAISVASMLVLGFVLMFWFRSRIHEIGTLLAIGKTKLEVFLQVVVELLIIAMVSFIPAMLVSNLTSDAMTKTILEQADSAEMRGVDEINVKRKELNVNDYVAVMSLGVGVILLATGGASISTMRLTPKQILTKMK